MFVILLAYFCLSGLWHFFYPHANLMPALGISTIADVLFSFPVIKGVEYVVSCSVIRSLLIDDYNLLQSARTYNVKSRFATSFQRSSCSVLCASGVTRPACHKNIVKS